MSIDTDPDQHIQDETHASAAPETVLRRACDQHIRSSCGRRLSGAWHLQWSLKYKKEKKTKLFGMERTLRSSANPA